MPIYLEHLGYHWIPYFPSPNARNFAWNFGGVYNSTRTMACGTFPLPVGTSKPEVGYFLWNRLYYGIKFYHASSKSDFESIGLPSNIAKTGSTGSNRRFSYISIFDFTYAINISYDSKLYCWFTVIKIFYIRPSNFFKSFFAWAELTGNSNSA